MVLRSVSVLEFELAEPGQVGRCEWQVEEARRDVEVLAWVGRFRFVTARAVATRFDVSWQQANARVRRLERLGLLGAERQHVSEPRAVFLTGKGHELLGWPRRRAPRAQVQREHEAAIVWLVGELERAESAARVLTERECRRIESSGERQYSVELADGRRRWPDVVVESGSTRHAIEIEFAPKGSGRLRRIVEAYELSDYDQAVLLVKSVSLGRRIRSLTLDGSGSVLRPHPRSRTVRVAAWPGLGDDERSRLDAALALP